MKRALLSVSDKDGLIEFAQGLQALNFEILSTGGTAGLLRDNGIDITEVADYTGFPEMMDGRLKTLHPKIHGGLLARRGLDDAALEQHGIKPIDLLVVNLYPFAQTIADPTASLADAIENIDIGGPAMLRAAAKNHASVAVVVDKHDYADILAKMQQNNGDLEQWYKFQLAVKAYAHTAAYDGAIAAYLSRINADGSRNDLPAILSLQFMQKQTMRYGENPHQKSSFYVEDKIGGASIANAVQIQGKELSFNNLADANAALECVKEFSDACCVIVKHANPCGVAIRDNIMDAYDRAFKTDPTSAFGGIIAFNRELDGATAKEIIARQFVEVIIAPKISVEAQDTLASKKNIRVLESGFWQEPSTYLDYKRVNGGLLVQDSDQGQIDKLKVVTQRAPDDDEINDLRFAWKVAKHVKSNAIVYCKDGATIGVGAGQMSRVYSAKIAGIKAQDENLAVKGSVMASDAFFPFRDGLDAAGEAGIAAVIQPGGSMRDQEVIDAANEHNIAMVFTGMRHFKH